MSKTTSVARGFEIFVLRVSHVLIWVCAFLLFATMIIISYEVTLRYIFETSLIWSFEIVEYILVALAMLSLAYIQTQGKHIKVEFVYDRFKPRTQVVVSILTTLIALFVFIMLTMAGWRAAWEAWTLDIKSWSIFAFPQFPVRVVVPIGSFIMCLYILVELFRKIAALQGKSEVSEKELAPEIETE